MPSTEESPIATAELERMAKGPTAWPAWALREALTELVRRRHADDAPPGDSSEEDIHQLFGRVRRHPDFVFGTIFVKADFPRGEVPADFYSHFRADRLCEVGNEMIADECGPYDDDDDDPERAEGVTRNV